MIKIKGLRKATENRWAWVRAGLNVEIWFDKRTGEVYAKEMTQNSYTVSGSDDVVKLFPSADLCNRWGWERICTMQRPFMAYLREQAEAALQQK